MDGSTASGAVQGQRHDRSCTVEARPGLSFQIVVDVSANDSLSAGYMRGEYPEEYRRLLNLMVRAIGSGGRVLDLGGHIGSLSLGAAVLGYEVVAVEAAPRNAELLGLSAVRNGFDRLKVVHAAVAEKPGGLRFRVGGPYGHVVRADDTGASIDVRAARVDDLLDELGWDQPDFIKLDVEGSEVAAIRGMSRRLARADAPPLFFESNGHTLNFFGLSPADLLGEISALGYQLYLDRGDRLVPMGRGRFQGSACVDYLALKKIPEGLRNLISDRPMSAAEHVADALAMAAFPEVPHRAYIARALARAPRKIARHARITQALRALRSDSSPEVREAASWSARFSWSGFFSRLRRHSV